MSANIVRLYYKENSKEPAVNEALVDLAQVSMIVRIGQQTVGLVVPGGWYEYALPHYWCRSCRCSNAALFHAPPACEQTTTVII